MILLMGFVLSVEWLAMDPCQQVVWEHISNLLAMKVRFCQNMQNVTLSCNVPLVILRNPRWKRALIWTTVIWKHLRLILIACAACLNKVATLFPFLVFKTKRWLLICQLKTEGCFWEGNTNCNIKKVRPKPFYVCKCACIEPCSCYASGLSLKVISPNNVIQQFLNNSL